MMTKHTINTNLRKDGVLEIYCGDKIVCEIGDGKTDENLIEDVLYGLGYQWNQDGTISPLDNK